MGVTLPASEQEKEHAMDYTAMSMDDLNLARGDIDRELSFRQIPDGIENMIIGYRDLGGDLAELRTRLTKVIDRLDQEAHPASREQETSEATPPSEDSEPV